MKTAEDKKPFNTLEPHSPVVSGAEPTLIQEMVSFLRSELTLLISLDCK